MTVEAGIHYYGATSTDWGQCLTSASSACLSASGNVFGNYGCFNGGVKRDPYPCSIGVADPCPVYTGFDFSQQQVETLGAAFAAGFTFVAVFSVMGIAVGALLSLIRK